MQIKNIAIVGGGTAGCVCALTLQKTFPKLNIDIIESTKIGIVGVGEGSTEHWRTFMVECDISMDELIKETDATFKYGINFKNWNGDGANYFHSLSNFFNMEGVTQDKIIFAYLIANKQPPKSLVMPYIEENMHQFPYWGINQFHFDTNKLNIFLHKLCSNRGINCKNYDIKDALIDDNGIKTLITDDNNELTYDFYIDCTGFNRLLLHKKLGIKWKSYSKYLPMNSAFAFPTELEDNLPSWTLSQALNNGWNWQIPTQKRFGNGYVFNDTFCTPDIALEEIQKYYKFKIEPAKTFKFDAGRLEQSWYKNCIAIGLASNFVEPLEATSIGHSIIQSRFATNLLSSYIPNSTNKYAENKFNKINNSVFENIIDFVRLHYITKRDDTEFWKVMKTVPLTDSLSELLDLFKYKMPKNADFDANGMFKAGNFILVMHGLGLISTSVAQQSLDQLPEFVLASLPLNCNIKYNKEEYVSHRKALQWLMDNPEHKTGVIDMETIKHANN